jgi:hypothetical protein
MGHTQEIKAAYVIGKPRATNGEPRTARENNIRHWYYENKQKQQVLGCHALLLSAVRDAKPQDAPPLLDQRVFLWESYVVGQDIDEVWWPTDLVSGYKRGPECRINSTWAARRTASKWPNMSHHRPPYA